MKPQDRTRAILRSQLEPSMRLVLIAFADHMNDDDSCFVSPETVRDETGLALSTVTLQIAAAEKAGILIRVAGARKSKDARISWEAVAAFRPTPTRRGGVRVNGQKQPNIGSQQPNIGSQPETEHRYGDNRTSVGEQPNIGSRTTEHRTLSDHEAPKEAISEAPNARADGPPDVVLPDGRTVPGDLPGLLNLATSGRVLLHDALMRAGIGTTRDLLRLDADERKFTRGIGPVLWNAVSDALAVRNVVLGCLANRDARRVARAFAETRAAATLDRTVRPPEAALDALFETMGALSGVDEMTIEEQWRNLEAFGLLWMVDVGRAAK